MLHSSSSLNCASVMAFRWCLKAAQRSRRSSRRAEWMFITLQQLPRLYRVPPLFRPSQKHTQLATSVPSLLSIGRPLQPPTRQAVAFTTAAVQQPEAGSASSQPGAKKQPPQKKKTMGGAITAQSGKLPVVDPSKYEQQLEEKLSVVTQKFEPFNVPEPEVRRLNISLLLQCPDMSCRATGCLDPSCI